MSTVVCKKCSKPAKLYICHHFNDDFYECVNCVMSFIYDSRITENLATCKYPSFMDNEIIYAFHKEDFINELNDEIRDEIEKKLDGIVEYFKNKKDMKPLKFEFIRSTKRRRNESESNIKHNQYNTVIVRQCMKCGVERSGDDYSHIFASGDCMCHKCYMCNVVDDYNKTKDLYSNITMDASTYCRIIQDQKDKKIIEDPNYYYRPEIVALVNETKYPEIWKTMTEINDFIEHKIPALVKKWNTDVWFNIIKSFPVHQTMKQRDIVNPNFKAINGYNISFADGIGRSQVQIGREKDRFYVVLNCSTYEPDENSSEEDKMVYFGGTNGSYDDVCEALRSIVPKL